MLLKINMLTESKKKKGGGGGNAVARAPVIKIMNVCIRLSKQNNSHCGIRQHSLSFLERKTGGRGYWDFLFEQI
jgi:hypothetical protein